ncbi:MAG: cytochrome c-type biogenesis protein [Acidimicrobiales bacterium]
MTGGAGVTGVAGGEGDGGGGGDAGGGRSRRGTAWWATKVAWLVLAAIAVTVLAIGSSHSNGTTNSARISHLDSIIKCPSCEDLSIAQSDAPSAVTLRREVASWVHGGWSDARISERITSRYGSGALLLPSSKGVNAVLFVVPVGLIGIGVAGLGWYLWRRRPAAARAPS